MTTPTAFKADLVTITRKRFSTTQGEVLVEYDGVRIEQYGDAIKLDERGEYHGYDDAFWMAVAKREAIARGLAVEPTPPSPKKTGRKRRPYFLLVERDDASSPFTVQFGDFDRGAVQAERDDYREHGKKASNLRVIRAASSKQADCDAAVAKLSRIASASS